MLHQILFAARDIYAWPPPSDYALLSDGHNKLIPTFEKGSQMLETFAALFYSTFFAIIRQDLLLGDDERCRTLLPCCRGPPPSEQNPNSEDKEAPYETAALHKNPQYHGRAVQHRGTVSALCSAAKVKIFRQFKKTFLNRKRFFLFKIYTPQHGLRDGGWLRLNPSERQCAIMDILRRERHTTTARLSTEFDVTERTIRNDITALSLTLPILTVRGRYGGGIKLADWFRPCAKTLSPKQEKLLHRLKTTLAGDDLIVLNSILVQFSPSHGCR